MPITQDRLHQLLLAAEYYQGQIGQLQRLFVQYTRQVRTGQTSLEQALDDLAMVLTTSPSRSHDLIINQERIHYQLTHAKNDRNKRLKQRLRATSHQPLINPDDDELLAELDHQPAISHQSPVTNSIPTLFPPFDPGPRPANWTDQQWNELVRDLRREYNQAKAEATSH